MVAGVGFEPTYAEPTVYRLLGVKCWSALVH
jgi:hypothetical protein